MNMLEYIIVKINKRKPHLEKSWEDSKGSLQTQHERYALQVLITLDTALLSQQEEGSFSSSLATDNSLANERLS